MINNINISVCSANCQGLGVGGNSKRRDVMKYLKDKKIDIYFIQDTHFTPQIEHLVRSEWGYECYFNSFSSQARGVAILLNNTHEYKIKKTYTDNSGNYIILHITIDLKEYVLVNIYAPNKDEPTFV